MAKDMSLKVALYLSIAGILFAAYMTLKKYISSVCAFGEACPYLFGHPVCIYGLVLFFVLFLSILTLMIYPKDKFAKNAFLYTSIIGVLYSGYYAYLDIFNPTCGEFCVYQLGLPTCVYGFIVFLAVFVCMMIYRKN